MVDAIAMLGVGAGADFDRDGHIDRVNDGFENAAY
jgi:hypothetical protein